MKSPYVDDTVLGSLRRLDRRVRWKCCLTKLRRSAWLIAAAILLVFLADVIVGLRTLSLRIAFSGTLVLAATLFATAWIAAWMRRVDPIGVAHLLEKRYPELAERLVTLVQIKVDKTPSALTPLLEAETAQQLAGVDPDAACSLQGERRAGLRTIGLLALLAVGVSFTPAFASFATRFLNSWTTPLVPFKIKLRPGDGYVLRGGGHVIHASVHMLDANAEVPRSLELVCAEEGGAATTIAMNPTNPGSFAVALEKVCQPLRCQVQAGEVASDPFELRLIDAPVFARKPAMVVLPPTYMGRSEAIAEVEFTSSGVAILEYSLLYFPLSLDRWGDGAEVRVRKDGAADEFFIPVPAAVGNMRTTRQPLVAIGGTYHAELVVKLEHGVSAILPLGEWTVHEDKAPRFTQPLRLQGGDAALLSKGEYRLAPGDAVKLQTVIEDTEGVGDIGIEIRVNDETLPIARWLQGGGGKRFVINDWLPLPSSLKERDRVQFRLHAADNRRMKKGESQSGGVVLPKADLLPQVTVAPAAFNGEDAWITLRIDQSVESYFKREVKAQADELRDVILKIRTKVQSELDEAQQLQRSIHIQSALTMPLLDQAQKLLALNGEICGDLRRANERFAANPELANLAEHFLEIAEVDMVKAADSLNRLAQKDRALLAEVDLKTAAEALLEARAKLDRLLAGNTAVAEDRLDRFQIDTILKRQSELADRLRSLLDEPLSDADRAKAMHALRQEQAKLAEETAALQEKSRLVQESLAAQQAGRTQRLADAAEQLAAQQQKMREVDPGSLPADAKDQLAKLAAAQSSLAERVQAFAEKNAGPDVKSARAAAAALKKPLLGEAIKQQKEHEQRLKDWLRTIVPGAAVSALREEVLQLAKMQKTIRADLDQLGKDLPRLDGKMLQQRLHNLMARQQAMPTAIAKLAIDASDERLHAGKSRAEQAAKQAGEQLASKDALSSYDSMEKAHQELEALANLIPAARPVKRDDIKDPAVRERIDKVEAFASEQEKLRKETERLLAEARKAGAKGEGGSLQEKTEKLAAELTELSQKALNADAKALAKESAQALEDAKKAMHASQEAQAKGEVEKSRMLDDEAAKKLEIAVKQTAKLAQAQAAKGMAKNPKTAESLKESGDQMRKAEANLPTMPRDAQTAMKSAAKSLEQASQQAAEQSAKRLPKAARNPAVKSFAPLAGGRPSVTRPDMRLEAMGKAWGDLPGALKTQMLQDVRDRFGEEYARMIQQYFERLAETAARARKERP